MYDTEFYQQMREFLIYFFVFGLWPLIGKRHKLLLFLYCSVLPTSALVFLLMFVKSYDNLHDPASLRGIVNNLLFISISVSNILILVETLVGRTTQAQLIGKFSQIDRLLNRQLNVVIPYNEEKRTIFILNSILASLVLLSDVALVVYLQVRKLVLNLSVSMMFSTWITRLRLIQVMFFVHLARNRLKLVNQKLINARNSKQDLFIQLLHLKQTYTCLFEISELISEMFGWSLLSTTTQCFIDLTCNCYTTFLYLEDISYEEIIGFFIVLTMAVVFLITFGCLAFYCSSCNEYV